ncbi:MAG: septum formation initiator family protein [Chlorobi bacterium]|nr:septum formation initiator family protein [Chlorobiota bacterium]
MALLMILVFVLSAAYVVFNNRGLLKYISLKKEYTALQEQVKKADEKNKSLRAEIDSLKTSDVKIEQVAREKYDMHFPSETGIKVKEK